MSNNRESFDLHILTSLSESLNKSGLGLLELIHFIMHFTTEKEETEVYLMDILTIKANIKLMTDNFIEMSKEILGKDYVEEKVKKYMLEDQFWHKRKVNYGICKT